MLNVTGFLGGSLFVYLGFVREEPLWAALVLVGTVALVVWEGGFQQRRRELAEHAKTVAEIEEERNEARTTVARLTAARTDDPAALVCEFSAWLRAKRAALPEWPRGGGFRFGALPINSPAYGDFDEKRREVNRQARVEYHERFRDAVLAVVGESRTDQAKEPRTIDDLKAIEELLRSRVSDGAQPLVVRLENLGRLITRGDSIRERLRERQSPVTIEVFEGCRADAAQWERLSLAWLKKERAAWGWHERDLDHGKAKDVQSPAQLLDCVERKLHYLHAVEDEFRLGIRSGDARDETEQRGQVDPGLSDALEAELANCEAMIEEFVELDVHSDYTAVEIPRIKDAVGWATRVEGLLRDGPPQCLHLFEIAGWTIPDELQEDDVSLGRALTMLRGRSVALRRIIDFLRGEEPV